MGPGQFLYDKKSGTLIPGTTVTWQAYTDSLLAIDTAYSAINRQAFGDVAANLATPYQSPR